MHAAGLAQASNQETNLTVAKGLLSPTSVPNCNGSKRIDMYYIPPFQIIYIRVYIRDAHQESGPVQHIFDAWMADGSLLC